MLSHLSWRSLHTSTARWGQKAKRRKQALRENNPHLPVRSDSGKPVVQALTHFDQFYSSVYKHKWSGMRLGLLCPQKFAVFVNNFGDSERTCGELEELGCVNINEEFARGQEKVQPYFDQGVEVSSEDEASGSSESTGASSDVIESHEPTVSSLDPSDSASRLMKPDNNLLGGNSVSMYQFMPTKELKGMEEFVEEASYYEAYKKVETEAIKVRPSSGLNFPAHLRCYTFPRGDLSRFPSPGLSSMSTLDYYCLDGASLLPVLALDVKPGHSVLDMCAGPGGKSLAILQTLHPASLVCNDVSQERVRRVISVLDQYLGRGSGLGDVRKTVSISRRDGTQLHDYEAYDRVLVDAPCYSDRHSVTSDLGNIFVKSEIKNRLRMPERQSELLKNGLLHLAPGGSLVYSTCTLSPVQNDGVVHRVLGQIWEETNLNFEVEDLDLAVKPFRFMCRIFGRKEGLKYGQLVVPSILHNFGPMYFCKINRI